MELTENEKLMQFQFSPLPQCLAGAIFVWLMILGASETHLIVQLIDEVIVMLVGVMDCKFHPRQPWLFTAGADSVIKLFCH